MKRFDGKRTRGQQVAHYHARQKARAHNVKYTSSGQAQWWERAMAAMT